MRLRHIIITAMLLSMPCISYGAAAWSTFDPNKPANTRRWDKADDDIRTNWAALWQFLGDPDAGELIVGTATGWQTQAKAVFDVRDYGATPDNATDDDVAAIQLAIDDANSAGGGVVYCPKGTYRLTSNHTVGAVDRVFDMYDNVCITGDGRGTVFQVIDDVNVPHLFRTDSADNCIFRNFLVDGSGTTWNSSAAKGAINFRSSHGGRVENVWIENWQATAIMMDMTDQTVIQNCYIYRPYEHGVYISGTITDPNEGGNIVRGCTIVESGYNSATSHVSIKLANTVKKALITENVIIDSTNVSIVAELSATDCMISNNLIKGSVQNPIRLNSTVGNSISILNNTIIESASEAIRISGGNYHVVKGNYLRPNDGKWCMVIPQTDYSSFSDNYIDGTAGTVYGIDLATTGASVSNSVTNNKLYGLVIALRISVNAVNTVATGNDLMGSAAIVITDNSTTTTLFTSVLGKHGLNTNDPNEVLDVNGNIVADNIKADGDITVSDDGWIGQSDGVKLTFDDTANTLSVAGGFYGFNSTIPAGLDTIPQVFVGSANISGQDGAGGEGNYGFNWYYDAGYKRKTADPAQNIRMYNGEIFLQTAVDSTVGSAITWVNALTATSNDITIGDDLLVTDAATVRGITKMGSEDNNVSVSAAGDMTFTGTGYIDPVYDVNNVSADLVTFETEGLHIINSSGASVTGTLAAGTKTGQWVKFVCKVAGNNIDITVSNHVTSDPEVIRLDAALEYVELVWDGTDWVETSGNGQTYP